MINLFVDARIHNDNLVNATENFQVHQNVIIILICQSFTNLENVILKILIMNDKFIIQK